VTFGDLLFAPSRERPLLAIKPGGRGEVGGSHVLWRFNNGPDVPSPVTDGKYLYSINDRGIMFCLDARTGAEVYGRQRLGPSTYSGSPVLADGKIYITDEDGVTSVVQAGPRFALLAENDFGEYTLSSPAISDGRSSSAPRSSSTRSVRGSSNAQAFSRYRRRSDAPAGQAVVFGERSDIERSHDRGRRRRRELLVAVARTIRTGHRRGYGLSGQVVGN
jgi:hypothetical protein